MKRSLLLICVLAACTEKTSESPAATATVSATEKQAAELSTEPVERSFDVVFDLSTEQLFSPFDSHSGGLGRLTETLRADGATVAVNFRELQNLLETFKGPGKVLVLGPALERKYSPEALKAINQFREGGGGVLVVATNENAFRHADMHNALTEAWGIRVLAGTAQGQASFHEIQMPKSHSNLFTLQDVRPFGPAPLRLDKKVQALLKVTDPMRKRTNVVGGLIQDKGKGTVVVLGDIRMLLNLTPSMGLGMGDNREFVLRTFRLLAGFQAEQPGKPKPLQATVRKGGDRGKVLIETSSGGLRVDAGGSGLDRLADAIAKAGYQVDQGELVGDPGRYTAVIVAAPLRDAKNLATLKRVRRLALFGEGRIDFSGKIRPPGDDQLSKYPKHMIDALRDWRDKVVKYKEKDYVYTLNQLANDRGLEFRDGLIVHKGDNQQVGSVNLPDGTASYFRAGPLKVRPEANDLRIVGTTYPGSWTTLDPLPNQIGRGGNPELPDMDAAENEDSSGDGTGPKKGPLPPRVSPEEQKASQQPLSSEMFSFTEPFRKTDGLAEGEIPVLVTGPWVFALADADILTNAHADREGKLVVELFIRWLTR